MNKFEDRLFNDLMSRHGQALAEVERKPAGRAVPRPVWLAGAALTVAAAVAAGLATFGNSPGAYAVTRNPDGSVRVSIQDIAAVDAANAKLREFGVRAKAVPMTPDCPDLDPRETFRGHAPGLTPNRDVTVVTIGVHDVPPGYTILLGVRPNAEGSGLGFTAPVKDPAPSCLRDPRFAEDR